MRARALAAGALLLVLGACQRDVSVDPTPSLAGLYELESVDDQPLAVRYADEGGGVERWLVGARLAFETDGDVTVTTVTQRRFTGGADAPVETATAGEYARAGDEVRFVVGTAPSVVEATGELLEQDEALGVSGLVLPAQLGDALMLFRRTQ